MFSRGMLPLAAKNATAFPNITNLCRVTLALKCKLVYHAFMSSVHEIETAVSKLSRQELLAFRDWFSNFDADAWDKQFEEDVATGHLDTLAEEAIRDLREGRCRDL